MHVIRLGRYMTGIPMRLFEKGWVYIPTQKVLSSV